MNYTELNKYLTYVQKKYELSREQYFEKENKQNKKCAICKRLVRLFVDHSHLCKYHSEKQGCKKCVRGLLCAYCNGILGRVEKQPQILKGIKAYLRKYKSLKAVA